MTPHVVIAGGGVGALEGLLALQALAGDRVDISVLTATRHLTYRRAVGRRAVRERARAAVRLGGDRP